jgi:hypothetical protein
MVTGAAHCPDSNLGTGADSSGPGTSSPAGTPGVRLAGDEEGDAFAPKHDVRTMSRTAMMNLPAKLDPMCGTFHLEIFTPGSFSAAVVVR